MPKKIIIDNNILDFNNIEKINNTDIFDQIKNNKLEFLASEKIFDQLSPFLLKCNETERKTMVDFLFKLTNGSRILDTVMNISQKELDGARGKYQYISCKEQKSIKPEIFYDKSNLEKFELHSQNQMPAGKEAQAHDEIKKYMENQRKIIDEYSKKKFADIDKYLTDAMKQKNFDDETIQIVLKITKNFDDSDMSTDEKKKEIYTKYYDFMQEFSLLLQLRDQKKLIKNQEFFKDYYKDYFKRYAKFPFTQTMIDSTLFGYSYKVKVTDKENPKYDYDWVNDNSYICYTNFADVLLTNDGGYMKAVFNHIYNDKKEILTLDNFIDKYCNKKEGENK